MCRTHDWEIVAPKLKFMSVMFFWSKLWLFLLPTNFEGGDVLGEIMYQILLREFLHLLIHVVWCLSWGEWMIDFYFIKSRSSLIKYYIKWERCRCIYFGVNEEFIALRSMFYSEFDFHSESYISNRILKTCIEFKTCCTRDWEIAAQKLKPWV